MLHVHFVLANHVQGKGFLAVARKVEELKRAGKKIAFIGCERHFVPEPNPNGELKYLTFKEFQDFEKNETADAEEALAEDQHLKEAVETLDVKKISQHIDKAYLRFSREPELELIPSQIHNDLIAAYSVSRGIPLKMVEYSRRRRAKKTSERTQFSGPNISQIDFNSSPEKIFNSYKRAFFEHNKSERVRHSEVARRLKHLSKDYQGEEAHAVVVFGSIHQGLPEQIAEEISVANKKKKLGRPRYPLAIEKTTSEAPRNDVEPLVWPPLTYKGKEGEKSGDDQLARIMLRDFAMRTYMPRVFTTHPKFKITREDRANGKFVEKLEDS